MRYCLKVSVIPIETIQRQYGIVGRELELQTALAVLDGGRHLLLEGPVGVGKTSVALAVCSHLGRETVRVDGDDRYSESRLTGWFDPPLVLTKGYGEDSFFAGPLVQAMLGGGVLFINELNRMPESVQNVLLPALDERLIEVPHIGEVRAADGFQVVATQNPADYVATGRLSEALRDRFEHLALLYQDAVEEEAIVRAETGSNDEALVRVAVRLTRATRLHPRFRKGASVRGAIAFVQIVERIRAEGPATARDRSAVGAGAGVDRETLRRAAEAALTTRVGLGDDSGDDVTFDALLDELLDLVVERGEDPDLWLAPGECATADRAALGVARPSASQGAVAAALACALEDRRALADHLRTTPDELDGWQLAGELSAGAMAGADTRAYACAQHLAAGAVLQRAARLVGPLKAATRTVREPLREPYSGELDVEATVDNILGKPFPEPGDWVVRRRVDRRRQVVLMIDTSLSMAGEKMALAAVAAAVLALKVHRGDLSVVLFADEARVVSRFGEDVEPGELVRRMLALPCGGGTHIAVGLEAGRVELQRGRDPRRSGLLLSDCIFTSGPDPCRVAARFGSLHVLLIEEARAATDTVWISPRRAVGEAIARASDGGLVRVSGFTVLPRRMLDVADAVLR